MTWLKPIAMLMLSLSIAFTGFSAQAKPVCPMAKMQMAMQDMKAHDCDGCAKEKQKDGGCCKDIGCNTSCSASGAIAKNLSSPVISLQPIGIADQQYRFLSSIIPVRLLNTQDRPPKSFA